MLNFLLTVPTPWFQPFVWMDYRLAVLITVLLPLILWIWALVQKVDAIQHLLGIYWRVASLLAISLYLMIAALPMSFWVSTTARILVPISLWFWVDLNEEIAEQRPSLLKLAFSSWRWGITVYSVLGALLQIPFLRCGFNEGTAIIADPFCRVWLDPPWFYKEVLHGNVGPRFLGFVGLLALVVYVLFLSYFLFIKLGKQGRSATGH